MSLDIVILAAGQGTRMRSALPKVLHPVAGQSMLGHVIATARALQPRSIQVVIGHGASAITIPAVPASSHVITSHNLIIALTHQKSLPTANFSNSHRR